MKKVISLVSCLLAMFAQADTSVVNGIEWSYELQGGVATIVGCRNASGAVKIPAIIDGHPVAYIGGGALWGCKEMTSVDIPDSVLDVGDDAFGGCDNLKSVDVPQGAVYVGRCCEPATTFRDVFGSSCGSIETVVIKEGVTVIGSGAFEGCWAITSLTIPSTVTSIGEGAFVGCWGLGDGVVVESGCAFRVDDSLPVEMTLPEGTRLIADYTFGGRSWEDVGCVQRIVLPKGLEYIGRGAFHCCSNLVVSLPAGLKEIGYEAFCGCTRLESIDIPTTVKSIGACAFLGCTRLGSVSIPKTVESVGYSAFSGTRLVNEKPDGPVVVDGCLLEYKGVCPSNLSLAADVRLIAGDVFSGCENLVFVDFPTGLECIGSSAFYECTNLKTVSIPPVVRVLEESAFEGCASLNAVKLSYGLERIEDYVFNGCTSLESLTVPASVTFVGYDAFGWDEESNLSQIDFEGMPPSGIEDAGINPYAHVRFNRKYESEWWSVVMACGFVNADPYDPSSGQVYGPFVPGETVTFDTGLIGYAAKGLPSGLKLNKKTGEITGAAKKPTGDAGVTVTFTKKNEPTQTAQFVVGPMPTIEIALAGDTEKCKVKGAGSYLVGKKVSLSATAPKGTAFVGWTANGVTWPNAEDAKKAKLSYVMTKESVSLVATFEKEKMRVACPALAAASFTVGVAGDATGIPIEIETQSGVKSVAVSKLPVGMKYDKKTGLIVGAPTKAGSFDVTIKVTAKSGAVETLIVPVKVAALPDWAVGTFVGMVRQVDYDAQGNVIVDADGRHDWYDGEMTVTVSAKGKISGKLTLPGGEMGAFSCSAYDSCGEEGCVASGSMKIGKTLKVDVELRVTVRSLSGGDADFAGDVAIRMYGGEGTESLIVFSTDDSRPLRQQVWKSKVLPLPPSVDKKSVMMERDGFLYALNFGKNGAVNDVLALPDNPKTAIKKGKPVFSIVGFWDSVWHCELFGTPIIDTAGGGEERLRVNVNITSDGSLSCALAE